MVRTEEEIADGQTPVDLALRTNIGKFRFTAGLIITLPTDGSVSARSPKAGLRSKVGSRKFALDSSLEGDGFELVVPRHKSRGFPQHSGHCEGIGGHLNDTT